MRLQRHDRAWLAPDFNPQPCVCDVRLADAAQAWIVAGRPFVVAGQQGIDSSQARLGLTLPGVDVRQRVGLVVPRSAIVRAERALVLRQAIDRAPPDWRSLMRNIGDLCAECRITPRVFGSLAAQLASGECYLEPGSDLDLLFECTDASDLDALLASLRAVDGCVPRIDGEVLLACGWAVAWRELDRALAVGESARVLARSASDVRLLPLAQLAVSAQVA